MKTASEKLNQITQDEAVQVGGGNGIVSNPSTQKVTLPVKPIRYYTQALGEDGGDLPDLLTM